ncbi:hypothetical protein BGX31_006086 [Mortierella sp. GBA43]|nr:hypothetical protein BGX31_006086 [Mortierella sp. GBA43]
MPKFSESQLVDLRQQFKTFDKNQDSFVSQQEFTDALKSCGLNPEEYDLKKIFVDDQGKTQDKVTFAQFIDAMQKLGLVEPALPSQADLRASFHNFDLDKDGKITKEELTETLANQGERPTSKEVNDMIKAADTDGDGKIDEEEFVNVNSRE